MHCTFLPHSLTQLTVSLQLDTLKTAAPVLQFSISGAINDFRSESGSVDPRDVLLLLVLLLLLG